jgi:hypothetical protein
MLDNQKASLANVLVGLGQGRFHDEATEALQRLVKEMNRVAEAGGGKPKGKLVITLDLMLDRGIFELNPGVKVTTPATVRARTIMFSTPDGQLSKNDLRQGTLGLEGAKDVGFGEVKDFRAAQAGEK